MHGRVKKVTNELIVIVTSDDLGYTKQDAILDAAEYVAENHPGERWEFVDVDLDKYNAWSLRYSRKPSTDERRTQGPDWTASARRAFVAGADDWSQA